MPDLRPWLHARLAPRDEVALLIGAGLGEDAYAAECWRRWAAQRVLDDVSWEEHRLLAHIAPRMATIAPSCAYRPRVEGLAKADWTRSQLILRASAQAIALLVSHGVEVMLLKGGALQVAVPATGVRISGDLDIMVPRARFADAIRVLYEAGWRSKDSMEYASARWHFASGTNLRKAPFGDIDVHHQPLHGRMQSDEVLDALWLRAGAGSFHGQSVRVPSLADLAVIATAHGVRARSESPYGFAWLFDLHAVLCDPRLEPSSLAHAAAELRALPAVQAGIAVLHRIVPSDASSRALESVIAVHPGAGAWCRFVIESMPERWGKPVRSAFDRLWPRYRPGRERDVIPRIRPVLLARRGGASIPLEPAVAEPRIRHEIKLRDVPSNCRALLLEIACPPGEGSRRRFDVIADGRILGRISLRVRRRGDRWQSFRCRIPLEAQRPVQRLSIEALGQFSVLNGATAKTVERARALPFSVSSLAAL